MFCLFFYLWYLEKYLSKKISY